MYSVNIVPQVEKDRKYYEEKNKKLYNKVLRLVENIKKCPYKGIGKPERLKHKLSEYWSRRISKEHRMIYKVNDEKLEVVIISLYGHYDNLEKILKDNN